MLLVNWESFPFSCLLKLPNWYIYIECGKIENYIIKILFTINGHNTAFNTAIKVHNNGLILINGIMHRFYNVHIRSSHDGVCGYD